MKNTSMNTRQLNLLSVGLLQVIEINERIFFVNLRSFTFSTIGNFFDIYLKHLFSIIFHDRKIHGEFVRLNVWY